MGRPRLLPGMTLDMLQAKTQKWELDRQAAVYQLARLNNQAINLDRQITELTAVLNERHDAAVAAESLFAAALNLESEAQNRVQLAIRQRESVRSQLADVQQRIARLDA